MTLRWLRDFSQKIEANGMKSSRGRVGRKDIQKVVLASMKTAARDFDKWTDGQASHDYIPESVWAVFVAQGLHRKLGLRSIWPEYSVTAGMQEAGAMGRGRPTMSLRHRGRCDILLCWQNHEPRAVIEVKREVNTIRKLRPDLERVAGMMKSNWNSSTFDFSMLAAATSAYDTKKNPVEVISKRLETFEERLLAGFDRPNWTLGFEAAKPTALPYNGAWAPFTVLIGRKKGTARAQD